MEKKLIAEGTTSKVYLIDNGMVIKHAKPHMWGYVYKEIGAYKKIGDEKHFPKLYTFSQAEKTLTISYCGSQIEPSNVPCDWQIQVQEIDDALKRKCIFHNDIRISNITVKDGIIYLVDFGHWTSSPKPITPDRKVMDFILGTLSSKNQKEINVLPK